MVAAMMVPAVVVFVVAAVGRERDGDGEDLRVRQRLDAPLAAVAPVPTPVLPPGAAPPLALGVALLLDGRDGRVVHEFAFLAREDAAAHSVEAEEDPQEEEDEEAAEDRGEDDDEEAVALGKAAVVVVVVRPPRRVAVADRGRAVPGTCEGARVSARPARRVCEESDEEVDLGKVD